MTTELKKAMKQFAMVSIMALSIWFGILVLLTFVYEPVPEAIIIGPKQTIIKAVSQTKVKLLSSGPYYLMVRSEHPGFVSRLYKKGAWLVLPGSVTGCLDPDNWIPYEERLKRLKNKMKLRRDLNRTLQLNSQKSQPTQS